MPRVMPFTHTFRNPKLTKGSKVRSFDPTNGPSFSSFFSCPTHYKLWSPVLVLRFHIRMDYWFFTNEHSESLFVLQPAVATHIIVSANGWILSVFSSHSENVSMVVHVHSGSSSILQPPVACTRISLSIIVSANGWILSVFSSPLWKRVYGSACALGELLHPSAPCCNAPVSPSLHLSVPGQIK